MQAFEQTFRASQIIADQLIDRKAVTGIGNGRRQNLRHGQTPEPAVQCKPAVHGTGHRDGQAAPVRNIVILTGALHQRGFQRRQRLPTRRAPGRIEPVQTACLGVPDNGKKVAADPVAGGLHQAQGGIGGNGRIRRTAAGFQNIDRHLTGQRNRGRRHALRTQNRAACRPRRSVNAVAAIVAAQGMVGHGGSLLIVLCLRIPGRLCASGGQPKRSGQ